VVEEGVCPPLSAVIHGHHHGGGGRGCRAPAKVVAVSSVESPSSCPWRGSEAARPGPERGSGAGRRDAGANGAGSPMVAPCTRRSPPNRLCAELLPPLRESGGRRCSGCHPVPSFVRPQSRIAVANGTKHSGIAYSAAVNFFTQHGKAGVAFLSV
jgi:hypothetical protein